MERGGGEEYQGADSHPRRYGRYRAGADVAREASACGEESEEEGCLGGVGLGSC